MPGIPVRFAKTVYISARYIAIGSSDFSPILNATEGDVGIRIKSNSLKTSSVFFNKLASYFLRFGKVCIVIPGA